MNTSALLSTESNASTLDPGHALACAVLALGLALASPAAACMISSPDDSATIPILLPGGHKADLELSYFEPTFSPDFEFAREGRCSAWIEVPLSAYPTWRVAGRPADFAPRIAEQVRKWGIETCTLTVWLNNDTNEALTHADACIEGQYRFDEARPISEGGDRSCYEGIDVGEFGGLVVN